MAQPTRVQALLEYLRAMDQALSRTARTGAAATSVHPAKKPSRVTGDDLRHALERNRATAAAFIDWKSEHTPHRATEISAALIGLAWIVNFGIIAGELYRAWPYITPGDGVNSALPKVSPDSISDALARLADKCVAIVQCTRPVKARVIASIEWEIGVGPLHPFYDGCGRVSRYFSTMLCLWHAIQPPLHVSREAYMRAATESEAAFIDYWVSTPTAAIPA